MASGGAAAAATPLAAALAALIVFALVMLAWVPFGAPNLTIALDYWQGLVTNWSGMQWPTTRILIILIPALWLDWVQYHANSDVVFLRWPRLAQAALLALAILVTFLITQADTGAPFVYQGF